MLLIVLTGFCFTLRNNDLSRPLGGPRDGFQPVDLRKGEGIGYIVSLSCGFAVLRRQSDRDGDVIDIASCTAPT